MKGIELRFLFGVLLLVDYKSTHGKCKNDNPAKTEKQGIVNTLREAIFSIGNPHPSSNVCKKLDEPKIQSYENTGSIASSKRSGRKMRQADDAVNSTTTNVLENTDDTLELRSTTKLEGRFIGTIEREDFVDLDYTSEDLKWLNEKRPLGFSPTDRTKLLEFDARNSNYPPFTYRGFFDTLTWHKIDIRTLMRNINRSFMLLEETCRAETDTKQKSLAPGSDPYILAVKKCEKNAYGDLFPVCKSLQQSPIDIVTKGVKEGDFSPYQFPEVNENGAPVMMYLPWDGTNLLTVELVNNTTSPEISGGALGKVLNSQMSLFLDRIHIHYGTTPEEGSEHRIDGKAYSMELQFIFTKNGRSKTGKYWKTLQEQYEKFQFKEAEGNPDVHILAVFVEVVSDEAFEKWKESPWNKKAADALDVLSLLGKEFWAVSNRRSSEGPDGFKFRAFKTNSNPNVTEPNLLVLSHILPPPLKEVDGDKVPSDYFSYIGSLTHPPCFENIRWGVYETPLQMNKRMWKRFLYIPSEFDDSGFVAGNFRNVSAVYYNMSDLKLPGSTKNSVKHAKEAFAKRLVEKSLPATAENYQKEDGRKDYDESDNAGNQLEKSILLCFTIARIMTFLFVCGLS